MAKGSSISKTAVWILMGLLILGLGGFGAVNLSGNIRTIGTVGDKTLPIDTYARRLQQQIQAVEAQSGQSLPFARAQEIGLDRAVLQQLVRDRALDHETAQMGLSIGDASLRDRILDIEAFQSIDGTFDRDSYSRALQRNGVSEAEFEASLREEVARTLLQSAVVSGVEMPATFARTLLDYVGEKRSFTWTALDADDLETPVGQPTEAELSAFFEANGDRFIRPATRAITYAILSPDALLDQVEIPEDELQKAYDTRRAEYQQPERRLVERLVYPDAESADRAAAALEVGGSSFETLVEERGLTLQDVDLGDVGRLQLDAAGEAVFAASTGDVVGPLPTDLGPALFRVNGVLPAQNVSFEDAREELQAIAAADRAERLVEAQVEDLDDRLAGGATLEQLAEETDMTLGQINWTEDSSDGIAAYAEFREIAATATTEDFPAIRPLEDGSIFAMRMDEVQPERPATLDEVRDEAIAAWRADQTVSSLTAQGEALVSQLSEGASFADLSLDKTVETDQTRGAFVDGTPGDFMSVVFEREPGEARLVPGDAAVFIVRLDSITAAGEDAQGQALAAQLSQQTSEALAQDLFNIYADDVVRRAGPQIDQNALNAVHVNFP